MSQCEDVTQPPAAQSDRGRIWWHDFGMREKTARPPAPARRRTLEVKMNAIALTRLIDDSGDQPQQVICRFNDAASGNSDA